VSLVLKTSVPAVLPVATSVVPDVVPADMVLMLSPMLV